MTFEMIPACDVPLAEQANVFSQAFTGYVGGSFEMDAAALARFILHQGADLSYSYFARTAEGLTGFAYINRTGNISRVAGMGVVPAARRAGLARRLLAHLREEAQTRGDQAMMLEVIEQNPAAHRLYVQEGFRQTGHLLSWRRMANAPAIESTEPLEEISLIKASQIPSALEFPDLPWQISRHAIAKLAAACAFRSGDALIVIGDPNISPIRLHALSCSGRMDWAALRKTLSALLQRYPYREFFTPAVFPEQFGEEVLHPLGFARDPLSQFLMRYDLQGATEHS
ncbi:MAG TPA: GNAT family N-acetyltransferase [Chthoniobacterales bacterium]|nr:GNAT family N-acetyltransferase [Chthoniobacterales bacterium]